MALDAKLRDHKGAWGGIIGVIGSTRIFDACFKIETLHADLFKGTHFDAC